MQSEAGAIAFVNHYFAQVNTAWMTPDPSLLPPLAEAGCKSCDNLEKTARELVNVGLRYDAPAVSVLSTSVHPGSLPDQIRLNVRLQQNLANEVDRNGVVVTPHPKREGIRGVAVVWQEGRWLLYGMA